MNKMKTQQSKNLQLYRVRGREGSFLGRRLLRPAGSLDCASLFLSFGAHSGPHGSCCYRENHRHTGQPRGHEPLASTGQKKTLTQLTKMMMMMMIVTPH